MTTDNRTNEPTPEQILWELYPDDVMDHNRRANCHLFLEQLRANGLLSEGAPSEAQIERAAIELDEDAFALTPGEFEREYGGAPDWSSQSQSGRQRAARNTVRQVLSAAGVAPLPVEGESNE